MSIDLAKLREPFPARDVEWRVQQSGLKGDRPWAKCLAYVTNRAIMDRLDEVCGPANWRNAFRHVDVWDDKGKVAVTNGGVLCSISILIDGQWVSKEDGAENTDIESVKGGLSSAMKRAGVQWGIGRYLYDLEEGWAQFDDRGQHNAKIDGKWFKWNPPALPPWALPKLHEPPPAASREANTLSPADQDRARQANPPPPPQTLSRKTYDDIMRVGTALGIANPKDPHSEWHAIVREQGKDRLSRLTPAEGKQVLLDLLRRAVAKCLTDSGENLDDVRNRVASLGAADEPGELTYEECEAVLESYEGQGAAV